MFAFFFNFLFYLFSLRSSKYDVVINRMTKENQWKIKETKFSVPLPSAVQLTLNSFQAFYLEKKKHIICLDCIVARYTDVAIHLKNFLKQVIPGNRLQYSYCNAFLLALENTLLGLHITP